MPREGKGLDRAGESVHSQEERRTEEGNEAKRAEESRSLLRTSDGPASARTQMPRTLSVTWMWGSGPGRQLASLSSNIWDASLTPPRKAAWMERRLGGLGH